MFPLIPVGILFLLTDWFPGAHTAGWVCLITGIVTTVFLGLLAGAAFRRR